ncbi:hypothetical protein BLL42_05125 [Pseudomonas frederiksbergensis]|uniref:Uncharacterized protein n=1 Tax=Pseudomonas frederiksbergensis TaxID=104087 RepID=A0A1J0EG95_9PSED|nr:hypothetical protein [Pseudomonas frederiksbergensis]APC15130.1 hypothetical protein BLL42_05125 [Pseudomonas frederiksbergensis]
MSEVMRWKLKGFIPSVEGVSKALFQPWVVTAEDFDRLSAERDALLQRLIAAESTLEKADDDFSLVSLEAGQRMDLLEGLLRRWNKHLGHLGGIASVLLHETEAALKPAEVESDDA